MKTIRSSLAIAVSLVSAAVPYAWSQQEGTISGPGSVAESPGRLEEIVVTARRRNEQAQDVPLALSVVGARELDEARANSIDRLQQLVPSVYLFTYNARTTSIAIRGLGGNVGLSSDALENGVGVFVDDVYLGRVGPAMFELVDIERVEFLRGPQVALLGRNTTAGAISIVTQRPSLDATDSVVEATVGDYGFREVKASISGPLGGDKVAGRASVSDVRRDGFMHNVTTGEGVQDLDSFTARAQLLIAPTAALDIRVIGDYAKQESNCCAAVSRAVFETLDNGAPVPNNILARTARLGLQLPTGDPFDRNVGADAPIQADMDQRGLSVHIDWALAGHELTSITARREWDFDSQNDLDDTALPVVTAFGQANRQRQTSQEIRVASRGAGPVDYVAGAYFFEEIVDGLGAFGLGSAAPGWYFPPSTPTPRAVIETAVNGLTVASLSTVDVSSNAAFGHGVWHAADAFDVAAGLRFTRETRSGRFDQVQAGPSLASLAPGDAATAQAIRNSFGSGSSYTTGTDGDDLSGTVTLSHRTRFGTSYLSIAHAHKAGGLNLGDFPLDIELVVRPETARHYEIGTKNRLFGNAFLNAAVYRTSVSDYQTSVLVPNAAGRLVQYISNIDKARSQGYELDVSWSPHLRFALSAALAYVDASYESFPRGPCPTETSVVPAQCDLSGQPLPGSPRRSWSLAIEGLEPVAGMLELYWRFDHGHRSEVFTAVSNSRYSRLDERDLVNLSLGIRNSDRRWDLMYWVRNALDEDYYQFAQGRTSGWLTGLPGEPRTSGLTYRGRF
jgi:iron complex outermembrane recepter protein